MAGEEVRIRRMTVADLDRVMEIASGLKDAPHWTRAAYLAAIDPVGALKRIALVAEMPHAEAKAETISHDTAARLKSCPDTELAHGGVPHQDVNSDGDGEQESCWSLVGFAVASVVAEQAELETIAVAGEFQRRGMARRLFAALLVELSAEDTRDVFLEVRATNGPAIGLYRSLGFEESGQRPRYYRDPVEDAVLLRRGVGKG